MSNDDEVLYRPVLDPDTHLGDSRRTPGNKASTVYSDEDNTTVDIAEWEPVYPEDREEESDQDLDAASALIGAAIAALASIGIAIGYKKLKPHAQRLYNEKIKPGFDSASCAIKRRLGFKEEAHAETALSQNAYIEETTPSIDLTTDEGKEILMSAFCDYLNFASKMTLLQNARFTDSEQAHIHELEELSAYLTSPESLSALNDYLIDNPTWFTEERLEMFRNMAGRNPFKEGQLLIIERNDLIIPQLEDAEEEGNGVDDDDSEI